MVNFTCFLLSWNSLILSVGGGSVRPSGGQKATLGTFVMSSTKVNDGESQQDPSATLFCYNFSHVCCVYNTALVRVCSIKPGNSHLKIFFCPPNKQLAFIPLPFSRLLHDSSVSFSLGKCGGNILFCILSASHDHGELFSYL